MMEVNHGIRQAAKEAKVRLWQIADKLELTDGNFSRRLRKELSEEQKQAIFTIIGELRVDGFSAKNDTL